MRNQIRSQLLSPNSIPKALTRRSVFLVFGLALLLAACSSGDDEGEIAGTAAPGATEVAPIVVNAPRAASAFQVCNLTSSTVGVAVG